MPDPDKTILFSDFAVRREVNADLYIDPPMPPIPSVSNGPCIVDGAEDETCTSWQHHSQH